MPKGHTGKGQLMAGSCLAQAAALGPGCVKTLASTLL